MEEPFAPALKAHPGLVVDDLGALRGALGAAGIEYTDDAAFTRWLCRIIENRIRDLGDYHAAKKRQPIDLPRSSGTGPVTAPGRGS